MSTPADTADEMAALKPCPVCGNTPARIFVTTYDVRNIECSGGGHSVHVTGATDDEVVTRWNTRADAARIDALSAEVARLRTALEDVGEIGNICVFNYLGGKVCDRCKCDRAALSGPATREDGADADE